MVIIIKLVGVVVFGMKIAIVTLVHLLQSAWYLSEMLNKHLQQICDKTYTMARVRKVQKLVKFKT